MYEIEKHYEGVHDGDMSEAGLQPKMDPVGIWTDGWGHAITDSKGNFVKGIANKALAYKLSKIHTLEDADKQLAIDLHSVDLLIARKVTITLTDYQREALRSFYYNCGYSETLTKLINTNSPALSSWWTSHYITGLGSRKPLPGLVARRKTEALLFTTGKLKFFN
ncbi:MAG: lysozyme [Bacteroidota bacterium]|nr:lysozyme [Bacteroidota bacterium]